jgi:hypothetical protein
MSCLKAHTSILYIVSLSNISAIWKILKQAKNLQMDGKSMFLSKHVFKVLCMCEMAFKRLMLFCRRNGNQKEYTA